MKTKPFYQSKTLWLQLIAVLSILFPVVQEWVSSNPVSAGSVFAALNTLVRFVTHGKIEPFKPSASGGVNLVIGMMVLGMAAAFCVGLSSCSSGLRPSLGNGQWSVGYKDEASGAKAGLKYVDGKAKPWLRAPIKDASGNVIGSVNVGK